MLEHGTLGTAVNDNRTARAHAHVLETLPHVVRESPDHDEAPRDRDVKVPEQEGQEEDERHLVPQGRAQGEHAVCQPVGRLSAHHATRRLKRRDRWKPRLDVRQQRCSQPGQQRQCSRGVVEPL